MTQQKTINKNSPLTLYAQVYEILFSEIENGQWEAGSPFPTVSDLSARFDVSAITIRRVISDLGKDGLLETSRGARTRVVEKSPVNDGNFLELNIAIIFHTNEKVPDNFSRKGPWTGAIINAVQDALIDNHYSSTLIPIKEMDGLDHFIENKLSMFSGIILVGGGFNVNSIQTMHRENIPFIIIGRPAASIENNYVTADFYEGFSSAAKLLIDKQAKRFLLIKNNSFTGILAMRGFQETLMNSGVSTDSIDILNVDDIFEENAKNALNDYLKKEKITSLLGIATTGDYLTTGAYTACSEAGLQLPKDVIMIGSNVIPDQSAISSEISLIKYPVREVGEKAVSSLFRMIKTSKLTCQGCKLPMEII